MNRRPPVLKLSKALTGYLQYKAAEGLSPRTLEVYEQHLKQWLDHAGDVDVNSIQPNDLRDYLAWMRTDYKPRRFSGSEQPLAAKTVRNIWVSLAAFYHWANVELNIPNPMKAVPAPKFEEAPVEPFTRDEIEALLKACEYCQLAETTDRRRFAMRRPTGKRDRALILTLLDTGLRASELCALKMGDLEQKTGRLQVKHGRAGVKNCHPHRFRHTMAITYLRSGGDVFTLQALLGHMPGDLADFFPDRVTPSNAPGCLRITDQASIMIAQHRALPGQASALCRRPKIQQRNAAR